MLKNRPIDISAFQHLYPFQSHYININGLRYHFLDEGAGDPIVMIHGNPTWSFYFRVLIKELSSQFRIIAPDHMGCGLSDKPSPKQYDYRFQNRVDDLETLLEYLQLKEKITLVVHDWGGIIGMYFAVKHLEKISRIIIMNTVAFLQLKGKKLPLRLQLARNVKPVANLAILGFNLFAFALLYMGTHKGLSKEVKSGLIAPYNSWKNRIAILKFIQDIPLRETDPSYNLGKYMDENLHTLAHIPKLICWGKRDFVFDTDYLDEWQRRFPNAETHSFSDAGHYVLEDEPEKIIEVVKNFLARNPIPG